VDERRLYDVGGGGTAWTTRDEARPARLARLRRFYGAALAVNALTWTLAGAALVLGGRGWGAGFGAVALLTAPLLALPALMDALARTQAQRRHRTRPSDFPRS